MWYARQFLRIGEGEVSNLYVDDIRNAFAIYWSCDAIETLWAKARDIRRQVFDAMQQFNTDNTAVIHIGMETFDGPEVEKQRLGKILNTIQNIDPQTTNLRWIFCHFFQAYSPPDENWIFDETVSSMSPYYAPKPPLEIRLMVVPDDADTADDMSHWERPLPV